MAATDTGPDARPDRKSFTLVSRQAPYGTDGAQICLELALAAAVYEQRVNYLFVEDGVYQLLGPQQPDAIASKNLLAALQALEVYGVDTVYVHRQSLESRGLAVTDLALEVELVDDEQVTRLVRAADMVFSL